MIPDYHRKQAETLIRLAQSTKDPETAQALMRLSVEHAELEDDHSSEPDDAS